MVVKSSGTAMYTGPNTIQFSDIPSDEIFSFSVDIQATCSVDPGTDTYNFILNYNANAKGL